MIKLSESSLINNFYLYIIVIYLPLSVFFLSIVWYGALVSLVMAITVAIINVYLLFIHKEKVAIYPDEV